MAKEKYTTEELRQKCEDTQELLYELKEQLEKQEKEEAKKRKEQLLIEKEDREKELKEAYNHYVKLFNAYLEDYSGCNFYGRMWVAHENT